MLYLLTIICFFIYYNRSISYIFYDRQKEYDLMTYMLYDMVFTVSYSFSILFSAIEIIWLTFLF